MSEVINFKQKRKAKARSDKEKTAAENRVKYGRTKAEKSAEKLRSEMAKKKIEGHKREGEEE